jgi:polyisoprenoid-binding protein YceI
MTTVSVRFVCVGVLGLFGTVVEAAPQHWRIDPVHSRVVLKVSHAGFSDSMATLSAISGEIEFDPQDWSSAQVQAEIPLHTLDFGHADWNRRMARDDFFAVKRYPVARFVSTRVIGRDETHAEVHGVLHFRGEEVPVVLQVQRNALGRKLPWIIHRRVGYSARATLLRGDFGIDRYPGVVGDEVYIDLQIEAERSRD